MPLAASICAALDMTVQAQFLELLEGLQERQNLALVIITHDFGDAARLADKVLVMYAGRVVEDIAAKRLHEATHPYTRGLLSCLPTIDGPLDPLPTLSREASWAEATP